jgi:hypothetical protein
MPTPPVPDWLQEALPEHLRPHVRMAAGPRRPHKLTLVFDIPGEPSHTIDCSPMRPETRVFKSIASIGYRVEQGHADQTSEMHFCETLAETLCHRVGDMLLAYLQEEVDATADGDSTPVVLQGAQIMLDQHSFVGNGMEAMLAQLRAVDGPIGSVELYLLSPCVQSCSFCLYPHLRGSSWDSPPVNDTPAWVQGIIDELRARGGQSQVVLSGADVLRHPQLDAMLALFTDEHEIGLYLIGPMTRLCEPAIAQRLAAVPNFRGVHLSLFGIHPETHDRIVACPGAHAQVMAGLQQCQAHDVSVSINTIVTPENVEEQPELLSHLDSLGLRTILSLYYPENHGYDSETYSGRNGPPISWRDVVFERLIVGPDALLKVCDQLSEAEAKVASAHNISHCWIPQRLRPVLLESPSPREGHFTHPPPCEACTERLRCPGITVPALEFLGPTCARPIGVAPG